MSTSFQNPGGGFGSSDVGGKGSAIRYPHPWFDVAQTYLPITIKHLFRWCHIYYQQNGLVNNVINRMAQYPVTKLQYKAANAEQERLCEAIFEDQLNLESFCISCNVDYFVYGNTYVSVHYPIVKYLECPHCQHKAPAESIHYKFEGFNFKIQKCQKCGSPGTAKVNDITVPAKDKIRLIRWNPMDIDVFYNEVTGESSYVLGVPASTAQKIRQGNPLFLNNTPQVFIDAVAKGHRILLSPYNVFHMRRENIAGKDMGLGQPMVLPALKDLYLQQVLKKSQEAIAHEHIVPLRIIHPAASGSTDPIQSLDLTSWQGTMRRELMRWRQDPNYTPIVPQPIGFQYMGGQGKSLMLVNEIKQLSESIVTAMNVPIEFAFGGMSFSGSSVTLRMLENQFLRNQTQMSKMVKFIIGSISRFLNVEPVAAEFVSIRTADDVQRKQLLLQLAQAGKVSDSTLLSEFNLDPQDEQTMIEDEQKVKSRIESKQFLDNAENQGKAQVIQARYQARAQSAMQQAMPQDPAMQGMEGDPAAEQAPGAEGEAPTQSLTEEQAQSLAKQLAAMPEAEQAAALQQLAQYIDQASLKMVQDLLQQLQQQKKNKEGMKPLPEKLPPRRSADKAVV